MSRISRQARGLGVVAVVLAGVIAGCGQSAVTPGTSLDPELEELGAQETKLLYMAEEILVARCMRKAGFEFEILPPRDDTFVERPYGNDDVDARRRDGYGSRAPSAEGSPSAGAVDPNAGYIASLSEQARRRFHAALFGSLRSRRGEVTLADGKTISFGLDGCAAEARGELYGDRKRYMVLLGFVDNLATEIQSRVVNDAEYIARLGDWKACMKKHGFPYGTPSQASMIATRLPRPQEIKIAVSDAQCAKETELVATGKELERRHKVEVYEQYEGRIIGYRELQRDAIVKAKRIVAQG